VKSLQTKNPRPLPIPACYERGKDPRPYDTRILYNGFGWDDETGEAGPIVVLFVDDIERIKLHVAPAAGALLTDAAYSAIRAKVGLEMLRLESMTPGEGGRLLTYAPPTRAAYRRGVQPLFLALAPLEQFDHKQSPFHLTRVEWKNAADAADTYHHSITSQ
jgi:hypothetical protein